LEKIKKRFSAFPFFGPVLSDEAGPFFIVDVSEFLPCQYPFPWLGIPLFCSLA